MIRCIYKAILKYVKQLFCKHTYRFFCSGIITYTESDFSGDGCYNTWQEHYKEFICTKCNKIKRTYYK